MAMHAIPLRPALFRLHSPPPSSPQGRDRRSVLRPKVAVGASASANPTITGLAANLTTLSNDQVFRQARLWKRFVRARTDGLESVRVGRAIRHVCSNVAAHITDFHCFAFALPLRSSPSLFPFRSSPLYHPSPSPATHSGSPPLGLQRLPRSCAHPLPPRHATPNSLPPPLRVLTTGASRSARPPRPTCLGSPLPVPSTHAEPPALSRAQAKGISTSTLLPLHPLGLPPPHGLQHPHALPCTTHSDSLTPPPPLGLRPRALSTPPSPPPPLMACHPTPPCSLPSTRKPRYTMQYNAEPLPPPSMCERGGGRVHKAGMVYEGVLMVYEGAS